MCAPGKLDSLCIRQGQLQKEIAFGHVGRNWPCDRMRVAHGTAGRNVSLPSVVVNKLELLVQDSSRNARSLEYMVAIVQREDRGSERIARAPGEKSGVGHHVNRLVGSLGRVKRNLRLSAPVN